MLDNECRVYWPLCDEQRLGLRVHLWGRCRKKSSKINSLEPRYWGIILDFVTRIFLITSLVAVSELSHDQKSFTNTVVSGGAEWVSEAILGTAFDNKDLALLSGAKAMTKGCVMFYFNAQQKITKMKTGCCAIVANGFLFLGHVLDFQAINDTLVFVINGLVYIGKVLHRPQLVHMRVFTMRQQLMGHMTLQIFVYFHPYLGKWSNLTNIFWDGLKPPTSKLVVWVYGLGFCGSACEKDCYTLGYSDWIPNQFTISWIGQSPVKHSSPETYKIDRNGLTV